MLALAIFFPVFEYFTLFRGEPKTDMFTEETVSSPARPVTPPAAAEEEGASEAPAPADDTATPGETSASEPAGGGDEPEN